MYIEIETFINLTNYVAQRAEQTLVTTLIMYIEIETFINLTNYNTHNVHWDRDIYQFNKLQHS